MPARPVWYRKLPYIVKELETHPHPYVDRATIQFLLGVGRRRAQQIMAPCIIDHVGTNGLADRDALIKRLQRLAEGDDGVYEIARRRKVAQLIEDLRQERVQRPRLLVEAPTGVLNQQLKHLPAGVRLEAGRITVEFAEPQQGLEKLLVLAIAISNDLNLFEESVMVAAKAPVSREGSPEIPCQFAPTKLNAPGSLRTGVQENQHRLGGVDRA